MLDGQVHVVTGAGRGIGRAIAEALARAGASVVVNDVDDVVAGEAVEAIRYAGGQATAAVAAIGDAEAADLCVLTAIESFGRMDGFVANAGVLRDAILWKATDDDFDLVVRTHLRGTFTCGRACARHFRETGQGGVLMLVSSVAGQRGNVGQTAYSAAKAGVAALARTWSMELARAGVSVNAIVPTALTRMVATIPGLGKAVEAAERGEDIPHALRDDLGLGTPQDVAPLAVFLASEEGRQITGQCIGIGGDRLSLWSHPQEVALARQTGGWRAEDISRAWINTLSPHQQTVGIDQKN
ncbi:SDR family NAD(P)-dependent oxidoreductase [Paracoccus rhizosphaerae]|uniref:SDR family NAD(P)-dependent oxidoreductase n=1 Tax=Paracoccus rhizosphaerae TaxID=1133347 RepID=A0ABV6CJD0_9RHOB|nr:SDR family NAD(P)-dependent oxidoreductase [Paracoccus rhizosphaerae]